MTGTTEQRPEIEVRALLMRIPARLSNTPSGHAVEVETDGRKQSMGIAARRRFSAEPVNPPAGAEEAIASRHLSRGACDERSVFNLPTGPDHIVLYQKKH
jgi:hypothetical protein